MNLSSLVYLNLSFNNVEGKIPTEGVFANGSAVEVLGNPKLCGGIQELHLPNCLMQDPEKVHKKHSLSLKLILTLVGVASIILLSLLLFSLYKIKNSKKQSDVSSSSRQIYPSVSYKLLHDATGGFSSQNLIGSGSFGTVYKGNLSPDETVIAVKVLHLHLPDASKSFMAECCQALRHIRHRNPVKVITACSSSDFQGNDFKAIVYPFMTNGSLEEWLHPKSERQHNGLNIIQRINILVDVAGALSYLHYQCWTPVVHCHIKPGNILLDSNLTAHVSDFGLTRLLPKLSVEANTNQFSSLRIKGTIGYAAPEYGMVAQISILGDVYSFGILVLEIFTGKRPTDELFQDSLTIHQFVKKAIPDEVMEIVDRSALSAEATLEFSPRRKGQTRLGSQWMECLVSVFQIGVICSEEFPRDRLLMRQVYNELTLIRDKFLQTLTQ